MLTTVAIGILKSKTIVILLSEAVLLILCLLGDHVVFKSNDKFLVYLSDLTNVKVQLLKAIVDNSVHGLVGLISGFIVTYPKLNIVELALTAFFSSIIDIDHFIAARSLNIKEAVSLNQRPFLHNSLTLITLNVFFTIIILFTDANKKVYRLSGLFFIAWFSHHVRDATRHGLWFGSLYTTRPLKLTNYLILIILTPIVIHFVAINDRRFSNNIKDKFNYLFSQQNNDSLLEIV
jgi:hypothetical protein